MVQVRGAPGRSPARIIRGKGTPPRPPRGVAQARRGKPQPVRLVPRHTSAAVPHSPPPLACVVAPAVPPATDVTPTADDVLPHPPQCPRCHGAGFLRVDVAFGHPQFGKPLPCDCTLQAAHDRQRATLWRISNLEVAADMTFASFNPAVPGTRPAWDAARAYAIEPVGWFLLSGPWGCGKTHLAAAIANQHFALGKRALFVVVPQFLDHLRTTYAPTSEVSYDDLFALVRDAELVVLDDLGAERATPWAQEKLFQLLNHRSLRRLPTVITTNLNQLAGLDERAQSRLGDVRLVRHTQIVADDYRMRPYQTLPQQEAS